MALYILMTEWNSYVWSLTTVRKEDLYTRQIGLARLYRIHPCEGLVDWPLVMAASTVTTLPVFVSFFVVERHLVRGITLCHF